MPIFKIYTISIILKFYKLYHESMYFGMFKRSDPFDILSRHHSNNLRTETVIIRNGLRIYIDALRRM